MVKLDGTYKRAGWANSIRIKTMLALDALAEQFDEKGKQAVTIAQEDLLTHTDANWWIENINELTSPAAIFESLSDEAKAAINALKA
jgi:hypothetical protein